MCRRCRMLMLDVFICNVFGRVPEYADSTDGAAAEIRARAADASKLRSTD